MRWTKLSALLVAFTAACGGAADEPDSTNFPAAPYAVLASDQQKLSIEIRTSPHQPPQRGLSRVQLILKDSSGAAQDDVTLDVKPWMPAMGHGTSIVPRVSANGHGEYVLDNVSLYMAGLWELRTTFTGNVTDSAAPSFDVP